MTQPARPPAATAAQTAAGAKPGCSAAACSAADCSADWPRASSAPACSGCCSVTASGRDGRLRLDARPAVADRARRDRRTARSGPGGSAASSRPWPAAPSLARQPVARAGRLPAALPGSAAELGSSGRRADRGEAGGLRQVREAVRRNPDRLRQGRPRRAARAHTTPEMLSYYLGRPGAEREPRRGQPDFRRQAAAGRSLRSLARRSTTNTPPSRCAIR